MDTSTETVPAQGPSGGNWDVLKVRLGRQRTELEEWLAGFDRRRKKVFGAAEWKLDRTLHVATESRCVPRDLTQVGETLLLGYNVQFGLKTETVLSDVFSLYARDEEGGYREQPLDLLSEPRFHEDFRNLYRYYRQSQFARFVRQGNFLFMVFRVGSLLDDLKAFKWRIGRDGLGYEGDRAVSEIQIPPRHGFEWTRTRREHHREGKHPHISIEDKVFVETIGGDLTIKVENNTESGRGILSEPVEHRDQTLDDAEIHYAVLGDIVTLRIRPFQEKDPRHFLYFCKTKQAFRVDSLAHSSALLPQQHGLLLPDGWALQSGDLRRFQTVRPDLFFDGRMESGTGEDHLYSFHDPATGEYTLLSYRLTEQRTETPISCHGWCLVPSGELLVFRAQSEPQSSHALQLWKTPFGGQTEKPLEADPWLEKIGNQDLVRFLAQGHRLRNLMGRDPDFAGLFGDLTREARNLADAHFWIKDEEAGDIDRILREIGETAEAAIGEYEKVERSRLAATSTRQELESRLAPDLAEAPLFPGLADCLESLHRLREGRGQTLEAAEMPFADREACQLLEERISAAQDRVGAACTGLLLSENALEPWRQGSVAVSAALPGLRMAREAAELDARLDLQARQLELLLETIGSLKEVDAVQSTAISDRVSQLLAEQNQVRSALRQRRTELGRLEGQAEFAAQGRLVAQALASALDLAATPEDCQSSLVRLLARLEELEARFGEVPEFLEKLADLREEMVASLDARRVQLLETRGRRCAQVTESGERILKGLAQRAESLADAAAVRSFFASDPLVDKVRTLAGQLRSLGDAAAAEELSGKLQTLQEDSLRKVRDRAELLVEGGQGLKLGRHVFAIQKTRPELAVFPGQDGLELHISGTGFRQRIQDSEVDALRDVWDLEGTGESPRAQRGEVLAWRLLDLAEREIPGGWKALSREDDSALSARLRVLMESSAVEGWQRGVHDEDALQILRASLDACSTLGAMRHPAPARAAALEFWKAVVDPAWKERIRTLFGATADLQGSFPVPPRKIASRMAALLACEGAIGHFLKSTDHDPGVSATEIADFLGDALESAVFPCLSARSRETYETWLGRMQAADALEGFRRSLRALDGQTGQQRRLALDWLRASFPEGDPTIDEVAAYLCVGEPDDIRWLPAESPRDIALRSPHPLSPSGTFRFLHGDFHRRLRQHHMEVAPRVQAYRRRRHLLLEKAREDLPLDGFRPKVLASFVRNRLADEVYLPLVGDNLAKQIGAMGGDKRSDRMGLLLLISPPGYGKTTLVEYLCDALGMLFVKINGPSLGRSTTGIDPAQARDGAARQELERLSLALEMGDNVLILIDDIQHCHPEFLQKFISLCDGQRRMDGTYKGKARTWDLRGRRVAVVMAGNPYTESGEAFRVPDMLANRADTFNLGDLAGTHAGAFRDSYLENCLMVNSLLARLFGRHRKDFALFLRNLASPGETEEAYEGNHSATDLEEAERVVRHLMRIRDAVLAVNRAYIASASAPEEYRTEPPFKLQGSYRNMNKLAEKVSSIMTDEEVTTLLLDHYQSEAQSLARESEISLLQVRRLLGSPLPGDEARWGEIMETWSRRKGGKGGAGAQALAEISGLRKAVEKVGSMLVRPPSV
ncbi:MAG: DNA repair ATPase [Fibrobacteria bacterium]|nr:DNA repair ATPase [Fibrobacteria bacterium]